MSDHFELVYGHSGSGKTTWWMPIAESIFKETGKKTRLYIGDGGVETVRAAGLVEDGIVEECIFTDYGAPFETARQISKGYWPDQPGPKGKLTPQSNLIADIGMWVYEGLTILSDSFLANSADYAARGIAMGPDAAIRVKEGAEFFGSNGMAHYGLAQSLLREVVQNTKTLPGFVQWTAHERSMEFKEENETIIGPAGPGKAITPKIPSWFGNTIHLTGATKLVKNKDGTTGKDATHYEVEKRAYLREHGDPDGKVFVKYLANTRAPLVDGKNPLPEYLTPPDALKFYALMAEARNKRRAARNVVA